MSLTEILDTFSKVAEKPHTFLRTMSREEREIDARLRDAEDIPTDSDVQEDVADSVTNLVKNVYDYVKGNEEESHKRTLPKLIINGFDDEQIWQELELQNESCSNVVIKVLPVLSAKLDVLRFPFALKCLKVNESTPHSEENSNVKSNKDIDHVHIDKDEEDEDDNLTDDDDDDDGGGGDGVKPNPRMILKEGKHKPSIVDDKFFKLSELELFLKNEDRNQNKPREDTDTMDFFENTDDTAPDYKYLDFFDNPYGVDKFNKDVDKDKDDEEEQDFKDEEEGDEAGSDEGEGDEGDEAGSNEGERSEVEDNGSSDEGELEESLKDIKTKKVRFSLLDNKEEESDEERNGVLDSNKKKKKGSEGLKSSLEQRQERLGHVIERLEEEAISEKPWQLKGEVSANTRPENSLLGEIVDFDLSVRPAPLITGEVTLRLEDIIKQRVKDKAWDDVERKVKPIETPSEFKKKLALDQEKSKLSLAQVYEQEFIRQREAATGADGGAVAEEEEPPLHAEVRSLSASLFNKLDALANYHYTPRPVAPELRVVSNVKAIAMEEVAPVSVADSALLAPQEITGKKRHSDLMSKDERTKTDKKRERRLKKAKQRQRQRDQEKMAKDVAKINPGLGNKYSKLKAVKQLSNVTKMDETKEKTVRSSTAFFNKLQDEVKSQIKSKTSSFSKKKDKTSRSAKKLKL